MSELTDDERREAIDAEYRKVAMALNAIAALRNPNADMPYVQAWVVACEWTSVEMERANASVIAHWYPPEQTRAAARGLIEYTRDCLVQA